MRGSRMFRVGMSVVLVLLGPLFCPPSVLAAWVNSAGTQFQAASKLSEIVPTATGTNFVDPTCGAQGGTSLALVRGARVDGLVDPALYPVVLVVSCLDGSATVRSRLNFINPVNVLTTAGTNIPAGRVVQQITTKIGGVVAAPSNGWAHLVHRPDKGDLLGCGSDGSLYSIAYRPNNQPVAGTATAFTARPAAATACTGLAWDADSDTVFLGLAGSSGGKVGRVVSFKEGATTLIADFTSLPCSANGMAISGGVLLLACDGALAIERLDKKSGVRLGVHRTITLPAPGTPIIGLTNFNPNVWLGDLACDPVTFQKDATGRDLFRDAMWSRRGDRGNGVAALEFPAFTCGLPSSSVVVFGSVPFSPLAAGLSIPGANGPGEVPKLGCFELPTGIVLDRDGDGIPDCWESGGINFDGDNTAANVYQLCVPVDTNGDGIPDATECADPTHKDLFVEIDFMQFHRPDPQALSQSQSVQSVGVKSVREAFAAAPVSNPDLTMGIRAHFHVDEQVTFTPANGGPSTSHVTNVALTPCTGPVSAALNSAEAADFDTIKAANYGTANERANPRRLNAKRLAVRYVLFAHNLVGNPTGGSSSSGCAEVGGDDGIVSLGSFAGTLADGVSHGRGTTDQQAGTFMHEFGHLLGLEHGGDDTVNCKPNYRSVMSYPVSSPAAPSQTAASTIRATRMVRWTLTV